MTIIHTPNGAAIDHMRNFFNGFCVYIHTVFDDETQADRVIYIGTCRLLELYNMTDARRNNEWRNRVTDNTVLTIQLIAIGTRRECMNERMQILLNMHPRPICNAIGTDTFGLTASIQCIQTGQTFRTQSEAAAALGIAQGRLSGHLRGLPGHNTINGYTFKRI